MGKLSVSTPLAKVSFKLDASDWHGYATETLWAELVSSGRYRLRNTPFFAKDVSFEDVVVVKAQGDILMFDSTSIAGGHSTYRILLEKNITDSAFLKLWNPLEDVGCSYESLDIGEMLLLAVDVPPCADIYVVYQFLEDGEKEKVWGFEEGHCGRQI